ncbi:MAG TPA: EAL domain-containing protein [Candidatus Sulfotelmatobacter sp.]|jgi:diguanylate cyclase (GGDEF)-like protein/PAS domain S-box-containing protein
MQNWLWIPPGVLLAYQQFRFYRLRRDARNKEEIFQIVTENAADMIALVDVKGRRLYNSPSYKRILGYSPAELSETSAFEQIHADDRLRVLAAAQEARQSGIGKRLEYRIKHKDGSWRVLESVASSVRDDKGDVVKLVIVNRDITERKRAEQQLEHHLFHDPLTGLANRRLFLDRLQEAYGHSRRDAERVHALMLINVDHFKAFNEAMGTANGDHVLTEIARRCNACLRNDHLVSRRDGKNVPADIALFRLSGDEYALLLNGVGDPSDALRVAKKIQSAVAEPFSVNEQEIRASVSVGIALSTDAHSRAEGILEDADAALRRAKALGGSRCEVFDEAMHLRAVGRLKLEMDLRTALTEKQFRVYYQPVVDLNTRQIVSFEALLRWEHPTQGLISPYRFIAAAEDTGILVSIGQWLMVQACRQLRDWQAGSQTGPRIKMAVNISARQLADARLPRDLQDALQATGIDPSLLELETTESAAAADPKLTVTVFSHLKHLGIGVILDDFGTGAASLRGLTQFPLDAVKIDRSLVSEMQADRSASTVVELIMAMAQKMNLRVIAEGIETSRQLERLVELKCQFGQGYYFSQPLESRAALAFMRQQVAAAKAGTT